MLTAVMIYLFLKLGMSADGGPDFTDRAVIFFGLLKDPFYFKINDKTPVYVLIALLLSFFIIFYIESHHKGKRKGIEYGSAVWGHAKALSQKLKNRRSKDDNLILSQNVRIGIKKEDQYRHKKNLNVLIDGGSGSGKSLNFSTPNILQANSSYFILDVNFLLCIRTVKSIVCPLTNT